ncbi:hypothetical protein OAT84_04285 [Gammaproteobacteria bacterium]|nr:hypothetical protein [Gammaproteobacteria bacterium]
MYTLIVGTSDDVVIQHFFKALDLKKNPHVIFIEMKRLGQLIELEELHWKLPSGGVIPHHQIAYVYNRMLMPPIAFKCRAKYDYLNWLLDEYYPNVINRPKHTMHNFSKVLQLEMAKDIGIKVPNSYIYANQKHKIQQGIFKSISSHRSIVQAVNQNFRTHVHEPVLFQQDCGRHNLRVHVLDQSIFVHKIISKQVDYRYDQQMSMQSSQIPDQLKEQCFHLMRHFSLRFAGIDWLEYEGEYYFLEINPSPGYAFYEQSTSRYDLTKCLMKKVGVYA